MSSAIEIKSNLVSADWLMQNFEASNLIIFDATIKKVTANNSSKEIKEKQQIKNARFLDIKNNFADDFEPLFSRDNDDEDDFKSDTPTMSEIWGLKHYIEIITDGKIIEMDHWWKQPVAKLFTELVYRDQALNYKKG